MASLFTSLSLSLSLSLTIDLGESYPRTSLPTTRGVGGRQRRAKEARGAKNSSLGPPAGLHRLSASRVSLARFARSPSGGAGTFKKNAKKSTKKFPKRASSPPKTEVVHEKSCLFFTQKDLPAPKKAEILHGKMTKN